MNRWLWFSICAILGLVMLACGLLVPMHLRGVDVGVIEQAGRNTTSLVEQGLTLARANQLGAAQILREAALAEKLPQREALRAFVSDLERQHPAWQVWGGPEPRLEHPGEPRKPTAGVEPFTEFVVRLENRDRVLAFLRSSPRPSVQELMHIRNLTNTVIFPPSQSSSGQALDAALSVCGLLMEGGHLNTALSKSILAVAAQANRGGNTQPFEQVLLDFMSLGQRLNWGQMVIFVGQIEDAETLRLLTDRLRYAQEQGQLPILYSAQVLCGKPALLSKYLMDFGQTGLKDLATTVRYGSGGVLELLRRGQPLHVSPTRQRLASEPAWNGLFAAASGFALRSPWMALPLKWFCYLLAGFFFAMALHFTWPAVSLLERPLQVRGFHIAREVLFALGFLLVVLLLSEPFLSQESQRVEFPIRLRLPIVGSLAPAGNQNVHSSFMNKMSLLTLLLFFVLQGLIYTACLVKLAEIRRQKVPPRIKLRLLENEDHLFDAGLYLGFVGTIISLILVSLGVIKPSLMAAYSSTSFGIIFVSVFKIFHLRPVRRKLLLEAETGVGEPVPPSTRPAFATQS